MKYSKQPETKIDLTPSNGELDALRRDMEAKTQERMNGRLQSRFHQVMLDRKVIRLTEFGDYLMCNPYEFTKMQKAEAMIEASDVKAEESYFEANPEEREAAQERRLKSIREIRKQVFGLSKQFSNQQTGG